MTVRLRSRLLEALACGAVLAGCAGVPALGPTPAGEGIIIYPHASFVGPSQGINVDVSDLGRVQGPCSSGAEGEVPSWADCISSVRVLPGWSTTLYEDPDYKGRSITLTADAPDLTEFPGPCKNKTFNDCISSIRVARR